MSGCTCWGVIGKGGGWMDGCMNEGMKEWKSLLGFGI